MEGGTAIHRSKPTDKGSQLDTIAKAAGNYLQSAEFSDVTFTICYYGKTKSFRAHRLILAMTSDVFHDMFYGSLSEDGSAIKITDIDPKGFEFALKYIYTEQVSFTSVIEAMHTLKAAEKYELNQLSSLCQEYIRKNISSQTLCDLMVIDEALFNLFFHDRLTALLQQDAYTVIRSQSFESLSIEGMTAILKCNGKNTRELELFKRVFQWGVCQIPGKTESLTEVREVLKPLFQHISFLSMTYSEFLSHPTINKLLTDKEKFAILANMVKKGSVELPEMFSKVA